MKVHLAPSAILTAADRLRTAEARVATLRTIVAQFPGPSPARDLACRELAVCERSVFNRRLELDELQRERRLGPARYRHP